MHTLLAVLLLFGETTAAIAPQEITFPSEDGVDITADLYMAHADKQTPFLVLFHRAGWSRGEYREVAARLNQLGWNCRVVVVPRELLDRASPTAVDRVVPAADMDVLLRSVLASMKLGAVVGSDLVVVFDASQTVLFSPRNLSTPRGGN